MFMLQDSGERREFETGAARDIVEGKGRCDLLPLDVVGEILEDHLGILEAIGGYVHSGITLNLSSVIIKFAEEHFDSIETAMLEVSKHYEAGAKKYSERNWEKGMPVHWYINSGVRHYIKVLRGDIDEPHELAFIWNMLGAIWTHKHHPELIDLPFAETEEVHDRK